MIWNNTCLFCGYMADKQIARRRNNNECNGTISAIHRVLLWCWIRQKLGQVDAGGSKLRSRGFCPPQITSHTHIYVYMYIYISQHASRVHCIICSLRENLTLQVQPMENEVFPQRTDYIMFFGWETCFCLFSDTLLYYGVTKQKKYMIDWRGP